jgi:hypothetical protein
VSSAEALAEEIAEQFAQLPQVTAVALAGSLTGTLSDVRSDIDLYIYSWKPIPLLQREDIARHTSRQPQLNNHFWEDGDEWIAEEANIAVDITYRSPAWIEEQLNRVLVQHQVSLGFSTCFWANVLKSNVLYDHEGWFTNLKKNADQPYPEALRRAIVAKNHPVLHTLVASAYSHQLEKAIRRGDVVHIHNRIEAILASYFDILYAVNHQPHPGEKRLVQYAEEFSTLPFGFPEDVQTLITSVCTPEQMMPIATRLFDRLDELLIGEGLLKR